MLAHEVVEVGSCICCGMLVRTSCAQRAVTLEEGLAYWTIGGDAMAIGLEEEG